jgi:carbon storage regulator
VPETLPVRFTEENMLVLSRKEGQRVHVGNDTTITITKIKGNVVRIGIEAPGHVAVLRGELADDEQDAAGRPLRLAS